MKSQVSEVTRDFWKNIFPFLLVIQSLTNSYKDKKSSNKIFLTIPHKNKYLKLFLSVWTENGVKYSYILWNLQTFFANIKNELEMVDILKNKNLPCRSKGGVKDQQVAVYLPIDLDIRWKCETHISCETIKWKNGVLKLSANFKENWRSGDKSGDLQALFLSPLFFHLIALWPVMTVNFVFYPKDQFYSPNKIPAILNSELTFSGKLIKATFCWS